MSNMNQKVISIKKITNIHTEQTENGKRHAYKQETQSKLELTDIQQQIKQLEQQKSHMLTDLRNSIEMEKAAWQETREKERQEAQEVGYKKGYDQGLEQVETQWNEKLEEINRLATLASEEYYREIAKHEETILELAVAVSEKIINDHIKEKPSYFTNIIQLAISELKEVGYIHIVVHPSQFEFVLKHKEEMEQIVKEHTSLSVYADPQLEKMDCILKHPNGQIDVSIDLQLKQFKEILIEKFMEQT